MAMDSMLFLSFFLSLSLNLPLWYCIFLFLFFFIANTLYVVVYK